MGDEMKVAIFMVGVLVPIVIDNGPTYAQKVTTKDQIVGNWKLLAAYSRNIDTGQLTNR
jgi:hypothetical protein